MAGRPAYVASDLLWTGGDDWQRRPFSARRKRLEATLRDGDRCVVSHALLGEGTLLAEALARFGLGAISARRLDARYKSGSAGEAWLRIPVAPVASDRAAAPGAHPAPPLPATSARGEARRDPRVGRGRACPGGPFTTASRGYVRKLLTSKLWSAARLRGPGRERPPRTTTAILISSSTG